MKAEFSISFAHAKQAENVLKVLQASSMPAKQKAKSEKLGADEDEGEPTEGEERAQIAYSLQGSELKAIVTAKDYAALRARSTSFMRDIKVVMGMQEIARPAKAN